MFPPRVIWCVIGFAVWGLVAQHANAQGELLLPNAPSQTTRVTNSDAPAARPIQPTGVNVRDLAIESYTKPRTIDRQFILLNTLLVAVTLADAETTLNCLSSPRCHEVNPILGSHPTRGKMYALAVPLTTVSVYLSYHYKRKSPSKGWWKVYPLTFSAVHSVGPIHQLIASHSHRP
jgi:hypothetical protein